MECLYKTGVTLSSFFLKYLFAGTVYQYQTISPCRIIYIVVSNGTEFLKVSFKSADVSCLAADELENFSMLAFAMIYV